MWKQEDNQLKRVFTFKDFSEALTFVNKVGEAAEVQQHHPDIMLSWGRVEIHLSTHSAGGVTKKDHELARRIDSLA